MITIKITPEPSSDLNRETIRQLIGYYKGIPSFSGTGIIIIEPKDDFNLDGLICSLNTSGYTVKVL